MDNTVVLFEIFYKLRSKKNESEKRWLHDARRGYC